MKIKVSRIVFLLLVSIQCFSQDHTSWSYNKSVYEVNVRQFTQEGTFEAFESHLDRLKDLGVGILWFMPIHPIGVQNRLGTLGSYYSVKDYLDVNAEFGTLEDFKSLVDKSHSMGFYVIIDWVANHTSWDNNLTITNPEWYTKDANGNFTPPAGTDWSDVIDLDYGKNELREYMINAMKFWIEETNIDGFRYDAASMVPLDFWESAIDSLKNYKPEILTLAEADGEEYESAGFDMTFAWELYGFGSGIFPKIISGTFNANNLASFIRGEYQDYSLDHYRLYFTSNHDENSWYGTVFNRFGDAAEMFAVITLTMNSVPLVYGGQEVGLNKSLAFFEKDQISWGTHSFTNTYKTLLNLKKENKALWNGTLGGQAERVLTNNNPEIFSFVREKEEDKIFAIFNVSNRTQNIIPVGDLYKGTYVNIFTNDTVTFIDSSEVSLSAWDYRVYKDISNITSVSNKETIQNNFILEQNYPNPFNPTTTIKYTIPKNLKLGSEYINLAVFDVLGSEIKTLVNKNQRPGKYKIVFDASNLTSGIYYYQLKTKNLIQTKKMLLIK